jgi:hypothetical protein
MADRTTRRISGENDTQVSDLAGVSANSEGAKSCGVGGGTAPKKSMRRPNGSGGVMSPRLAGGRDRFTCHGPNGRILGRKEAA